MVAKIVERPPLGEVCQTAAQFLVKPTSAPEVRWKISRDGQETTMRVQVLGMAWIPTQVNFSGRSFSVDTVLVWGIQALADNQDAQWEKFWVRLSDNAKQLGDYDEVVTQLPMSLDLTTLLSHLTQLAQGSIAPSKT